MAEMTTLLAAIYRRYTTIGYDRQKGISPGITSRFEVFYDENFPKFEVSAYTPSSFLQNLGYSYVLIYIGARMLGPFHETGKEVNVLFIGECSILLHHVLWPCCFTLGRSLASSNVTVLPSS